MGCVKVLALLGVGGAHLFRGVASAMFAVGGVYVFVFSVCFCDIRLIFVSILHYVAVPLYFIVPWCGYDTG